MTNLQVIAIYCAGIAGALLIPVIYSRIKSRKGAWPRSQKVSRNEMLARVENGQRIKIYWTNEVKEAICVNNAPSEKKMLVKIIFAHFTHDQVKAYHDEAFSDFITLNCTHNITQGSLKDDLKLKLQAALAQEDYKAAAVLRDAISKLEPKKHSVNDERI